MTTPATTSGDDVKGKETKGERKRKRVVVALSGNASADAKMMEYASHFVLGELDDVHVVHWHKGATPTVYGPGRIAGSYKTVEEEEEASLERPGVRRAALSAESMVERASEASAGRALVKDYGAWLPEYVRAELLDRRMRGAITQAVQVDSMSGSYSADEMLLNISEGKYGVEDPSYKNDHWCAIPSPDLIIMGCRGHGFVKRALLGSVSASVLNRVPKPTLFFRETLPPIEGMVSEAVKVKLGGVDQRVVCVAMSGSNASRRLVEFFVTEYIQAPDCVLLLHCASASQREQKDLTDADVEENLSQAYNLVSTFQKEHPHPNGRVTRMTLERDEGSSDVRDRIVEFLALTDINLLIVGRAASSAHRLRSAFVAPFTQYCVYHAPCPVLVYNPPPTYRPAAPVAVA